MTLTSLKVKLENSLEMFAIGIFLSTLLLFITVILDVNRWIFCFLPSLFIFSCVGAGVTMKSLVSFTRLKGKPIVDPETFEEKFTGSSGINSMFWVIVVIIAIIAFMISLVLKIDLIDNGQLDVFYILLTVIEVGVLCWGLYNIISQLAFVIFFISVIPTLFETEDVESKFFKELSNPNLNSTYNTDKNLSKLLRKYNDRIDWLESHMTEEKETEYKAKIYIYETCLRDIADIKNKLDI